MKKALKITGISLLSLIGLILIVACIAIWMVLSPKRITPIVKNQVEKFIDAEVKLGGIELTIFRTFPKIGVKISDVCIINPVEGSPSDTLASIGSCIVSINLRKFLKEEILDVDNLYLENGYANIYTNCDEQSNFDIFGASDATTEDTEESGGLPFKEFLLEKTSIKNFHVLYEDCPNELIAELNNFSTNIKLNGNISRMNGVIELASDKISCSMAQTTTNILVNCNKVKINLDGSLNDDIIEGFVKINLPQTSFSMANESYLNSNAISLDLPFSYDSKRQYVDVKGLVLGLEKHLISLKGNADLKHNNTNDILMNVDFGVSKLIIDEVLPLIPQNYLSLLAGIDIHGAILLSGSANGVYSKTSMPKVKLDLLYDEGKFSYSGLDYDFRDVYAKLKADIDFSDKLKYDVDIDKLSAKTMKSNFDVSGKVTDTTGNIFCNLKLAGNLNLPDAQKVIPDDLLIDMTGNANLSVNAKFKLDDVTNMDLMKTNISGRVVFSNLDVLYEDTIKLVTPKLEVAFAIPNQAKNLSFKELVKAEIISNGIIADVSDNIHADLKDVNLNVGISNILDKNQPLAVKGSFRMSKIVASIDTINVDVSNPKGTLSMAPSKVNKNIILYDVEYLSDKLSANMGDNYRIGTAGIGIKASAKYDERQDNMLLKWNPEFDLDFKNGRIEISQIFYPIHIPTIKMNYDSKVFNIHESEFSVGNSTFDLSGTMSNVDGYLKDSSLLTAVFDFTSDFTNVSELMDLVNGFGGGEAAKEDVELESPEDNPFMVPLGIDFRLNTLVKKATVGGTILETLGGHLTIKDGVLVLEEMGFTSKAAKMQLTAMYRSPRKNHLFAGFDFHLLETDIEELMNMIPQIDEFLPMLKAFKGQAECHIAAETNLKSNYDPKMSTLRAALSISGQDLVLLDGEMFSEIAKMLMFNKKTENLIDSMNVELTVFRDEVDLYPFLITMDKYQAVVAGRHNLDKDLSFDYHISITDCPLPIRLGLNVSGKFSAPKFKLVPTQYANLYNPKRRNVVQAQTLKLQQMIRQSLHDNVKEF